LLSHPGMSSYRFQLGMRQSSHPSMIAAWFYHAGKCDFEDEPIEALGWEEISPDLTKKCTPHICLLVVGPITNEGVAVWVFHHDFITGGISLLPRIVLYAGSGWWAASCDSRRREKAGRISRFQILLMELATKFEVLPMILATVYVAFNSYKIQWLYPRIFQSAGLWKKLTDGQLYRSG